MGFLYLRKQNLEDVKFISHLAKKLSQFLYYIIHSAAVCFSIRERRAQSNNIFP
jgi:hypothetical protein